MTFELIPHLPHQRNAQIELSKKEKKILLLLQRMSSSAVVLDVIKPHVNFHALLNVKRG